MARGKLRKVKFCPWCGTATVERDTFNQSDNHHANDHVSWTCSNCLTGFSVAHSPRTMFVHRMYAQERQLRPPEERIRQQLQMSRGGSPPLRERPLEELEQIEKSLTEKKPHTKTSREHIESSLRAVRNEIERRKTA